MEDTDAIWDSSVEDDFIHLVERGWDKEIFSDSAQVMLGKSWQKKGLSILKKHAPDLVEKFNALV